MKITFKIKYSKNKSLRFLLQIARNLNKEKTEQIYRVVENRNYNKIFCIGFGKTGTTSIEQALKNFGFKMGNQSVGEILAEDWAKKRTYRIINFCNTADAFQDMPFGLPKLYKELDNAFPNSKFILTVRNNENKWFNSLIKFHAKIFAKDKTKPPNETDLKNALYRYKGWALDTKKLFYDYPNIDLYNEKYYKNRYLNHIKDVKEYFKNRSEDLLILNVAQKDSYQKLAKFLDIKVDKNAQFPWLNKT